MKILMVHNKYAVQGRGSGEEVMIEEIRDLFEKNGHIVIPFFRSSLEIDQQFIGKIRAFFSGIYSFRAKKEMAALLKKERPDLVFVQNLYPLLSPSVLVACKAANVPVVMRAPNYRLVCPNGLFLSKGSICEKCSAGREYWCVLRNCEGDLFKSIGYALRSFVARKLSLFNDNVNVILVLTEFAKRKLIENGFSSQKVSVLSGLLPSQPLPSEGALGKYVGFVGRISPEKGVDIMIEAAKMLPDISFRIAGNIRSNEKLEYSAPKNVEFLGHLEGEALKRFYEDARCMVVPSLWYEGLPVVMLEAMQRARPVICSRIGGLPEVVEDNVTGLLFEPGNAGDLARKIALLWADQDACKSLGQAGHKKAADMYSPEAFYQRLMNACEIARRAQKGSTGLSDAF